ncbi:MAG: trypsin-like peptidase domain-containing protein [Thiotrichaceae bacterium]|nr:trypsin-like peptidase domain-containing protein [Thiotrichaceae bacterium]
MKSIYKPLVALTLCLSILGTSTTAIAKIPIDSNGQLIPTLADMLEKATPAVVNIHADGHQVVFDPATPALRQLYGRRLHKEATRGTGSGIIIDHRQGYILTNAHVINGASKITVSLNDNRVFTAKLIGADRQADIAVIQIPAEKLTALKISNSDKLRVGDFVVAIGNPYGIGQSVSSGIISALGRNNLNIEEYENFIQTDAPINPGNSGGALINLKGELIGINTAILGNKSGGNVGIGFAIPSNMATNLMDQLINYGEVQRGHIGIQVGNLTPRLVKILNSPTTQGAVIKIVVLNSPAARAGLQEGDIIIKINDAAIKNEGDVRSRIGSLRVSTRVNLRIIRNGKSLDITSVVGKKIKPQNFRRLPIWDFPQE